MWQPTYSSDELYHYGIRGQKWGVRHYQNPDGSYTPAGLARYGRGVKAAGKKLVTAPRNNYVSTTTSKYKKNYGDNDVRTKRSAELDKKISDKYKDDYAHVGKWFVKEALLDSQFVHTWNMSRAAGESRGKAFVRSVFDINVAQITSNAAGNAVRNKIVNSNTTTGGMIGGRVAGTVVTDVSNRAFRNTGSELSLQQRAIRKKYVNAPTVKKKKKK